MVVIQLSHEEKELPFPILNLIHKHPYKQKVEVGFLTKMKIKKDYFNSYLFKSKLYALNPNIFTDNKKELQQFYIQRCWHNGRNFITKDRMLNGLHLVSWDNFQPNISLFGMFIWDDMQHKFSKLWIHMFTHKHVCKKPKFHGHKECCRIVFLELKFQSQGSFKTWFQYMSIDSGNFDS